MDTNWQKPAPKPSFSIIANPIRKSSRVSKHQPPDRTPFGHSNNGKIPSAAWRNFRTPIARFQASLGPSRDGMMKPSLHCQSLHRSVFRENRIFFGGDWPVCTLGASLGEWIGSLSRIIASRPESLQRKLFHENAERVYRF